MARGSVTRRGESWRIAVELEPDPTTGKRRQRFETFHGSKKEADVRLVVLLTLASQHRLVANQKTTLGEFLEAWLRDHASTRSPKTLAGYTFLADTYVIPRLGALRLAKVTPSQILSLLTHLRTKGGKNGQPLSPSSVSATYRMLHTALACAVKWELLTRNPVDAVDAPSVPRKEMRTFTSVQGGLSSRRPAFFTVLMSTGLRLGEVVGLRWKDIDLDIGVISVQQTIQRIERVGRVVGQGKTSGSRRRVSLGPDVVALLREHRADQAAERLQRGPLWKSASGAEGLVFASQVGTPLEDASVHRVFGRICEAAGVPRIRPHDLRHTMATLLLTKGVHPKIVSERLGHSSIGLTLGTYSHVLPGLQEQAAGVLDDVLRQAP